MTRLQALVVDLLWRAFCRASDAREAALYVDLTAPTPKES